MINFRRLTSVAVGGHGGDAMKMVRWNPAWARLTAAFLGLAALAHGAVDEGASGIPEIIAWQTGGELSFSALEKKAASGNARARAQLGFRLMMTRERPYDAGRVFKLLSQAARAGDALGHAGLSWCYAEARGCEADPKLQFRHATTAAATGFHHGIYQLALCHQFGRGVPRGGAKADALLDQAIQAGSPWAKRLKAVNDYRQRRNREQAAAALEELAEKDFPAALQDTGQFALNGRDEKACVEALGRSARLGSVFAMGSYGKALLSQGKSIEGADWLMEAEERGDPFRQGELGKIIYEADELDEKSLQVAGSYAASFHYLNAALKRDADDPDLATKLAFQYCHGQGTKRDHQQAVRMIREAWEIFDRYPRTRYQLTLLTVSSCQIYQRVGAPLQDLPRAIAYAQYCPSPYGDSVGNVAWLYSLAGKGQPNDPVRGWAAVITARRLNLASNTLDRAIKNLEGKLDPEELQKAKELSADEFPVSLKYQREAAAVLGRPRPE